MIEAKKKARQSKRISGPLPWWAWQGLNLRPLRCQHKAVGTKRRKTANPIAGFGRKYREQRRNIGQVYRNFTARSGASS